MSRRERCYKKTEASLERVDYLLLHEFSYLANHFYKDVVSFWYTHPDSTNLIIIRHGLIQIAQILMNEDGYSKEGFMLTITCMKSYSDG